MPNMPTSGRSLYGCLGTRALSLSSSSLSLGSGLIIRNVACDKLISSSSSSSFLPLGCLFSPKNSPIGEICLFALRLLLLLFCLFSPIGEVCLVALLLLLLLLLPSSCEDSPAIASAPSISHHARDGWDAVHRRRAC